MYRMNTEKKRRTIARGIARTLTVSLLFGVIGSHVEAWSITAQATESNEMESGSVLSLGAGHSAVIKTDGSLWIWGRNFYGQLGNGTKENSRIPIKIMEDVREVSLRNFFSAAIKTDGSLWVWGYNIYGQLGNETKDNSLIPIKIMEDVKAVSLGGSHSAAIKTDGSLWTWGNNSSGQLGNGTKEDSLIPIKIMEDVRSISLGHNYSAAIKTDGSLWTWGNNSYGSSGNGNIASNSIPIKIMEDVREVSLESSCSAVIKTDGSLWMWGNNSHGQLGNGTKEDSLIPIKIMENVKEVSLESSCSAAIKTDGSLWMWGNNFWGQLGNGTCGNDTNSSTPIKIMEDVREVSLGGYYNSAAIKTDGSLWMWGLNHDGEFGNGTQEDSSVPIEIMPAGSVLMPGTSPSDPDDDPIELPIDTEVTTQPQIKVVDTKGNPIADAEITYRNKVFKTSAKGIAELDNYAKGYQLVIKKDQYITKTIPSFVKSKVGRTTYILNAEQEQKDGANGAEQIIVTQGDSSTDMLTKDAYINVHDKNEEFSIKCNFNEPYEKYILYAGDKKIAESSDGNFSNLRCGSFKAGQQVSLGVQGKEGATISKKNLNMQAVDLDPTAYEFSLGENISIEIPDDAPILGGQKVELCLGDSPVEFNMCTDGQIQIGINVGELAKEDKDWFSILKQLNKDNLAKEFSKIKKGIKGGFGADFDVKVIGYVEGNVLTRDNLRGRIFLELSAEGAWEKQGFIYVVPVVIEVSIEGKLNADASISYAAVKGFYGGGLSAGGEFALGLYGGVGLQNLISGGIYGKAGVGIQGTIFPEDLKGIEKLYVSGEAGVKGKVLGNDIGSWRIIEKTYYFIPKDSNARSTAFAIDNDHTYDSLSRAYLTSAGTMSDWTSDSEVYADGSVEETFLQGAVCLDLIPQVVRMGDTVMLFYLADAGVGRDAADRSQLVYSLWDQANEIWGEPKAVLEDDTADFNPDLYSDGTRIYAVWQEAQESLAGDLTLNEMVDRLILHAAVYDAQKDQFVDLGLIESENSLYQQNPQIVADGEEVSVYWYENAQDNVLGLSGTNRIYRARLTDQTVLTEGVQVMSVSEESVSENTVSAFRKFVALTEEDSSDGESVSENTIPEDDEDIIGEEENITPPANSEESVSENTVPQETVSENTVSENTISENTLQANTYGMTKRASQLWEITFLGEEKDCIYSVDAGRTGGNIGYAYTAGKPDGQYDITDGKTVYLPTNEDAVTLDNGRLGNVRFTFMYAGETLTWYQDGDICYLEEKGNTASLFGESRLPSVAYALLSDGTGNPEVVFPVNVDSKSELYRIGQENGAYTDALKITEQEDYIQYVDGFVKDGKTMLVYNRMKVNEKLEEINNSLCMGVLEHKYYDIALKSVDSMVRQNADTGEDVLEISAQLYNNGTEMAESISLSLSKADGTLIETMPVEELTLEAGESAYATVIFDLDSIQEAADYQVTAVSEKQEANTDNNSVQIALGNADLRMNTEMLAIADSRNLEVSIINTGAVPRGGNLCVRDVENGKEYCNSSFEPITRGQTILAEISIDNRVFMQKDALLLEVTLTPEGEEQETITEYVSATAPTYQVNFVTDTEISTVYAGYGKTVEFPKNPAKEGAHFAGWYDTQDATGGTLYTEETPIKSDVTLYARFVQEQTSIPLENCSVSEIPTQLYTGKALKPAVTVKWGSEVLKVKTDYTLTYQNNKEQGKATVTITGKGKYSGTITRSFSILYPISKVSVKAIPAVNFTGEEHTPDVTVTYNKKTLVKNTDYTVTYTNNRNAGTAGIILTGKGRYSGTKTVTFQIKGTSITGMVFEKIPDVPYNGSASRPIVTVKTKDGTQLMSGSDYRLAYENTVNKGTAAVTVIGNGNYTGTKKLTYKVVAKPLMEAMISGIEDAVYTGSPVKPTVTVKDGGTELAAGKDYTVSYSKNKAVGTATVTVKGKGNYSGTVKIPFAIRPVDLAQAETAGRISVRVNDIAYTGKALKPAVQVYETIDGKEKKIPAGGYTLSYADNVEMGTGTVTVTGKGSYTGTVTAQFRIVEKAKLITASTIKIDAISALTYTGEELKPAVHIVDKSDKTKEITLETGRDYEVTYRNNVNAGKATVTIKGIGSYAGSKDVTYKISKRAVGNKTVLAEGFEIGKISDERYTGYALRPNVVVKDQGKTLVPGTDYKLSYKNNTKIGTALVTLTGIGNYSGSYNAVSFNIVSWDYNELQARIEDQVYTGKALKPQVTFYTGGEAVTLKSGMAVKIAYKDNKNAGTATVTITGNGELRNMTPITVSFEIEPADITDAVVSRIPNQTLKGVAVKPVPKVKVGKNTLKVGRDFTVSYLRNGVKGEAEAIITGTGNYTGECRKRFIVQ